MQNYFLLPPGVITVIRISPVGGTTILPVFGDAGVTLFGEDTFDADVGAMVVIIICATDRVDASGFGGDVLSSAFFNAGSEEGAADESTIFRGSFVVHTGMFKGYPNTLRSVV